MPVCIPKLKTYFKSWIMTCNENIAFPVNVIRSLHFKKKIFRRGRSLVVSSNLGILR
jgi:hypothetical protein